MSRKNRLSLELEDIVVSKRSRKAAAARHLRSEVGKFLRALDSLETQYPPYTKHRSLSNRVQDTMRLAACTLRSDPALKACARGDSLPTMWRGEKRILLARGGRINPLRTARDALRQLQGKMRILNALCAVGANAYFLTLPYRVLALDATLEEAANAQSQINTRLRALSSILKRYPNVVGGFARTDASVRIVDGKPRLFAHAHVVVLTDGKASGLFKRIRKFWHDVQSHDWPPGVRVHLAEGGGTYLSGNDLKNLLLYVAGTSWCNGFRLPKFLGMPDEYGGSSRRRMSLENHLGGPKEEILGFGMPKARCGVSE